MQVTSWSWVFASYISMAMVSYGICLIPLLISSPSRLATLATFARGRLIGTGILVLLMKITSAVPITVVAEELGFTRTAGVLCDLAGILFMFIADRRARLSGSHVHVQQSLAPQHPEQNDTYLQQVQQTEGSVAHATTDQRLSGSQSATLGSINGSHQRRIFLFTFALALREFMDHIDLSLDQATSQDEEPHPVAFWLFMTAEHALTGLALTTILRSASLPAHRCERHLVVFTATPLLGVLFYFISTSIMPVMAAETQPFATFGLYAFTGSMFIYAAFVLSGSLAKSGIQRRGSTCTKFMIMAFGAAATHVVSVPLTLISDQLLTQKH